MIEPEGTLRRRPRWGWLPRLDWLGIIVVVWISRWPFLGPGYGDDADAWRVAEAARLTRATGVFHSSRVPGHPVSDVLCALLYPLGPVAITGMTAFMSALAAALFHRWLKAAGARNPLACAAVLAFLPAYYVTSTTSLDFAWAFAFQMGALLCVMHSRTVAAGLLLGLAIGCRNTSGAFLLPLAIILAMRPGQRHPVRAVIVLTAVSVLSGALTYLPVYLHYGFDYLVHYWEDPYPAWPIRLAYSLYELTGLTGGVALAGLLLLRVTGVLHAPPRPAGTAGQALPAAAWTGVVLYGISFAVLPHEGIYLLPMVPFALFLADRYLFDRRAIRTAAAAMLISSMLLSIDPMITPDARSEAGVWRFALGGFDLAFSWRGPVPSERASRRAGATYADDMLDALVATEPPAALVAGRWQPQLMNHMACRYPVQAESFRLLYLVSGDELARHRKDGYAMYKLAFQDARNMAMFGVDLEAEGVRLLVDRTAE